MLKTGGVGLCGRDVKRNGLCRLLPPLSCYLCPCFVAFRHGPHQEMLDALLQIRQLGEEMGDERIKRQLDDVCAAISEVLAQLGIPSSGCALVPSKAAAERRDQMNEEPAPIGLHLRASAAFQALVRAGQEQFAFRFPEAHQCFDAPVWDMRAYKNRPLVQSNHQSVLYTFWDNRSGFATRLCPGGQELDHSRLAHYEYDVHHVRCSTCALGSYSHAAKK